MNKLLTKIAGGLLGISLAVGVGVTLGGVKKAERTEATTDTTMSVSTTSGTSWTATDGAKSTFTGATSAAGSYYRVQKTDDVTTTSFKLDLSEDVVVTIGAGYYGGKEAYATCWLSSGGSSITTTTAVQPDSNGNKSYQLTLKPTSGNNTVKDVVFHLGLTSASTSKYVRLYSISIAYKAAPNASLSSISVTKAPDKIRYLAGDSFDKTGMVVTATYSDSSTSNVTDSCVFSPETIAANTTAISISYTEKGVEKTTSQSITVVTVSSVVLNGDLETKTYTLDENWDVTGLYLTITYSNNDTEDINLSAVTYSSDPVKADSLSIDSVTFSGTYLSKSFSKTITGISVLSSPVTIDIVSASASGKWYPTASGSTFTDSAGNTATLTTDAGWIGTSGSIPQFGKNNSGQTINAATYVEIVIPFANNEKAGIESVSASFRSNGASSSVTLTVYGDTDNDVILTATVTGNNNNGATIKKSTDNTYEKINAKRLKYRFVAGGTGVVLNQLTYLLGPTVVEFGTMVDLQIQTPTSDTQFKVGDTFSASGLVLRAYDNSNPVMTKDLTTGFKFGNAKNDNSFSGHVFNSTDATTGSFTVYVTATVGEVTLDVTYGITVTEVPTYSEVTNYSALYEGAKVIIVSGDVAFGAFNVGSYGEEVTPEFTNDIVTDANGATEFTIRIFGNKFGLQFGSYYLALNGDNNQVHRNNTLNSAGAWEKDNTGIHSPVGNRYLRYCTGTPNKFICNTSGNECSLYISDKSSNTASSKAETFAYRYLHMRDYLGVEGENGSGYCKSTSDGGLNYFNDAATAYATLCSDAESASIIASFKSNNAAVKRFQDWAKANGKTINLDTGEVSTASGLNPLVSSSEKTNAIATIVIISMTSVGAIAGYFFIRKRRFN